MNQLFYFTFFTLGFAMSAPYVAILVFDDIQAVRKFLPGYVLFMCGSLWVVYALVGLGRLVFGLPFIW